MFCFSYCNRITHNNTRPNANIQKTGGELADKNKFYIPFCIGKYMNSQHINVTPPQMYILIIQNNKRL